MHFVLLSTFTVLNATFSKIGYVWLQEVLLGEKGDFVYRWIPFGTRSFLFTTCIVFSTNGYFLVQGGTFLYKLYNFQHNFSLLFKSMDIILTKEEKNQN